MSLDTTVLVQPYQMLDGRVIKVGRERFEAAEVLFHPDKDVVDGMFFGFI